MLDFIAIVVVASMVGSALLILLNIGLVIISFVSPYGDDYLRKIDFVNVMTVTCLTVLVISYLIFRNIG